MHSVKKLLETGSEVHIIGKNIVDIDWLIWFRP